MDQELERATEEYARLTAKEQADLLTLLAVNVSIGGRAAYYHGPDERAAAFLAGLNEALHVLATEMAHQRKLFSRGYGIKVLKAAAAAFEARAGADPPMEFLSIIYMAFRDLAAQS